MALACCGSLTTTVNFFMTPVSVRLATRLLTAASERSTRFAISTNETRESSLRIPMISSSVLSVQLRLLGRDDLVEHLYRAIDRRVFYHYRRKKPHDVPPGVGEDNMFLKGLQEDMLNVHSQL